MTFLANISEDVRQIRSAILGREVRGAIANAIEKTNSDVSGHGERIANLEKNGTGGSGGGSLSGCTLNITGLSKLTSGQVTLAIDSMRNGIMPVLYDGTYSQALHAYTGSNCGATTLTLCYYTYACGAMTLQTIQGEAK